MVQLTGFSDPVYAEAYVNVNQYDIVLDVLIVNQTPDTLQGLTLELATLGSYIITCMCVATLVCVCMLYIQLHYTHVLDIWEEHDILFQLVLP